MKAHVFSLVWRAVLIAAVAWCSVPAASAQVEADPDSSVERVRKRRNQPRRYDSKLRIHITDLATAEDESEDMKEDNRAPKIKVPRYPSESPIPAFNPMRDMDPYSMSFPEPVVGEEEEYNENWILPPAPDIEMEPQVQDPLEAPWEYLRMRLESDEEEYMNRMFLRPDSKESYLPDHEYLLREQEKRAGFLEAGEHLLYSGDSHEAAPAEVDERDESSSIGDRTIFEPVVVSTAIGQGEDGALGAEFSWIEPGSAAALSEADPEVYAYGESDEWAFGALYTEEFMNQQGVALVGGFATSPEEEGLSMTSRLLMGLGFGEEAAVGSDEQMRVSEDSWQKDFRVLAHTLGGTRATAAAEPETAAAVLSQPDSLFGAATTPSPLPEQASSALMPGAEVPQPFQISGPFQISLPGAGSPAGTFSSSASLGVSGPGPTTDFQSNPRKKSTEYPGFDVKNFDTLMH